MLRMAFGFVDRRHQHRLVLLVDTLGHQLAFTVGSYSETPM
jgi:hypothetical protein